LALAAAVIELTDEQMGFKYKTIFRLFLKLDFLQVFESAQSCKQPEWNRERMRTTE
jgi:hypothetical protein